MRKQAWTVFWMLVSLAAGQLAVGVVEWAITRQVKNTDDMVLIQDDGSIRSGVDGQLSDR